MQKAVSAREKAMCCSLSLPNPGFNCMGVSVEQGRVRVRVCVNCEHTVIFLYSCLKASLGFRRVYDAK